MRIEKKMDILREDIWRSAVFRRYPDFSKTKSLLSFVDRLEAFIKHKESELCE